MAYTQYSQYAQTGGPEDSFQRINPNPNASDSEAAYYPTKYDVFVNKENSNLGGYAVLEEHNVNEINLGVLYLNHRIAVGSTGEYDYPILSDGDINSGLINIFDSSITFATNPTGNFTVSYTARGDQVHDSHLNALQNSLMSLMNTLGLKTKVSNYGTGLLSEKPCVAFDPASEAEYDAYGLKVPSAEILPHLKSSLKIGSTENVNIYGYGTSGTTHIYLGASGASRNNVYIDTDYLRIAAREGVQAGEYFYGSHTGDVNTFTGRVDMASQLTVGFQGGALIDPISTAVPGSTTGGAFYSGAAIRAHGGIWFGEGLSGFGDITFIPGTGSNVDIEGALECDSLTVLGASDFYGTSNWYSPGGVYVNHPATIGTNNDITLNDKPGSLGPSHIDRLDPSYAKHVVENLPSILGSVTHSVRTPKNVASTGQYTNVNSKLHPVWGFEMYPIIGGWSYTGVCQYTQAKSVPDHPNILLLASDLSCVGRQRKSSVSNYRVLGQGSTNDDGFFGHYSSGLFDPGDTYVEIKGIGPTSDYSFPIYQHEAFVENAGATTAKLTGLNLYIAADDDEFQNIDTVGMQYRIYQPGNAPLYHLKADFSSPTAPTVAFGNNSTTDYPNVYAATVSDQPWLGGANIANYDAQFKKAKTTTSTVIIAALKKSIHYDTWTAEGNANPFPITTGVAFIYATHKEGHHTDEEALSLKASPSPYGIAAASYTQNGSSALGLSKPGNEVPVGEVWATTVDGSSWTEIDTVSYRTDGYYDSCWIPLVKYQWDYNIDESAGTADSDWVNQTRVIGRCLPFYGSNLDSAGTDNLSNVYEDDENDDGSGESKDLEVYQFFVEHNLGPVKTASDITMNVWIASYSASNNGGGDYVRHPLDGEMGNIANTGVSGSIWQGSNSHLSLWGNWAQPYSEDHSFKVTPHQTLNRGYLKEISANCTIRTVDSRFAMVSVNPTQDDQDDVFQAVNGDYASYIRVIMNKTR
jgi:hypothetical protein